MAWFCSVFVIFLFSQFCYYSLWFVYTKKNVQNMKKKRKQKLLLESRISPLPRMILSPPRALARSSSNCSYLFNSQCGNFQGLSSIRSDLSDNLLIKNHLQIYFKFFNKQIFTFRFSFLFYVFLSSSIHFRSLFGKTS